MPDLDLNTPLISELVHGKFRNALTNEWFTILMEYFDT